MLQRKQRADFINEALRVFDERNGQRQVWRTHSTDIKTGGSAESGYVKADSYATTKQQIFDILDCDEQTLLDAIARGEVRKTSTNAARTIIPAPHILLSAESHERIRQRKREQYAAEARAEARRIIGNKLGLFNEPVPILLRKEAR